MYLIFVKSLEIFDKMLKKLINLLYPKLCGGCDSLLLKSEIILCCSCLHKLPYTYHHKFENNDSINKLSGLIPIEFGCSLLYFHKNGITQNLIHNLKYRNQQKLGIFLGKLQANDFIALTNKYQFSEIIPVPLHPKKQKERGYNQVSKYGETLADLLKIEYNPNLLIKKKYSKSQTKKNRENREKISDSFFDIIYSEKDYGKHFLLIDDVITTGATLEACAKTLLKIPDCKVSFATIANTLS